MEEGEGLVGGGFCGELKSWRKRKSGVAGREVLRAYMPLHSYTGLT